MRLFMLVKLALYETLSLHYVVNLLLSSLTTAIPDLFSKRLYALARPAQPRDFRLQNWAKLSQIQNFKTLKSLKSQGGRFSFMAILNLQDVPFHPVVVVALGKNLFNSVLGHCDICLHKFHGIVGNSLIQRNLWQTLQNLFTPNWVFTYRHSRVLLTYFDIIQNQNQTTNSLLYVQTVFTRFFKVNTSITCYVHVSQVCNT